MKMRERRLGLLAVACSAFALACYGASDEPQAGGHTNWLECEQFADCQARDDAVECSGGYCLDERGERIAIDGELGRSPASDAGAGEDGAAKPSEPPPQEPEPLDPVALEATFDGEHYRRIWGTSDDDVWALGAAVVASGGEDVLQPAIEPCNVGVSQITTTIARHYDGQRWTRSEIEAPPLYALHGSDAQNVWAVGPKTVLRLQAGQWMEQDIADAIKHEPSDDCYQEASLWSVFARAPDDVWVVGHIFPSDLGPGLILHFDGAAWTRMPVAAPDGFFAVWASAADDAWAAGSSGIVYHFDGVEWSAVSSGTEQYLWSIWGSASDDVWMTGNGGTQLHFDGTGFQSVDSSQQRELRSLTGRAADDIWNVTTAGSPNTGQHLMHWDGERWQGTRVSSGELISALWVSPSGALWSAGSRLARRN